MVSTGDYIYYNREINKQLIIYKVVFVLLFIGCLFILISKAYFYFFFMGVVYLIRDLIFPIYIITVNGKYLIIKRILLGGLLIKGIINEDYKVVDITNIDSGVIASAGYIGTGPTFSSDGTDKRNIEFYWIKYLKENNTEAEIKLKLSKIEANIIDKIKVPFT